jgi:hypothetical protein
MFMMVEFHSDFCMKYDVFTIVQHRRALSDSCGRGPSAVTSPADQGLPARSPCPPAIYNDYFGSSHRQKCTGQLNQLKLHRPPQAAQAPSCQDP